LVGIAEDPSDHVRSTSLAGTDFGVAWPERPIQAAGSV
jgi:hypothetical protein